MYLIDMPPPTISGLLHLGHIFSYSHMDFIARFQENLKLKKLVYPFGYDNNGLPTEKLGLKEWESRNLDGPMMPEFAMAYSHDVADIYRDLFKQMNMTFRKEYYTGSIMSTDICLASFEDLKKKGLCYFAETEFYYCPKTNVSVSQSELTEDGRFERSGEKVIIKKGTGWFIKIKERLPEIREAIDQIKWHPDSFRHRLHRWLDDIQFDWSISRSRDYGIEIPAERGQTFDTWFISSLTPQLAWHAHQGNQGLAREDLLECPVFDVRFQAHDIIRTWALFTIVKSLYHNEQIPWHNIVISGHALDKDGHKISKSAGNFVPPQTYIDEYGSDAVRYWAAQNQVGTDTRTDVTAMDSGRKLCNKLKNARKFIALGKGPGGENKDWFRAWMQAEKEIHDGLSEYNWSGSVHRLRDFFWNEFCDKFIEQSKTQPGRDTLEDIMTEMLPYFGVFMPSQIY